MTIQSHHNGPRQAHNFWASFDRSRRSRKAAIEETVREVFEFLSAQAAARNVTLNSRLAQGPLRVSILEDAGLK
jgi:hypothetical protein